MRNKTEVEKELGRIPTQQELVDKCCLVFQRALYNLVYAEGAYRMVEGKACKEFLQRAESDIEEIRTLVGATTNASI